MDTKLTEEIAERVVAALAPAIREAVAAAVAEHVRAQRSAEAGGGDGGGPARLLTARQVAAILQVPTARVYALARGGRLPRVKLGVRQVRFAEEALREWIGKGTEAGSRPRKGSERSHGEAEAPGLFDGAVAGQRH